MKINSIISPYPYITPRAIQTNFGYRLPENPVNDIKFIPNLTCAVCDEKMLSHEELNTFLDSFIPNSKQVLENPIMEQYKNTDAYTCLKAMSAKSPNKRLCALVQEADNRLIIEKQNPKTQKLIQTIVYLSNTMSVKSPQVIKKFEKIKKCIGTDANELLKIMEMYSIMYPNNTFSEIFQKPDVYNYHNKMKDINKKLHSQQIQKLFKQIDKLSKSLSDSDKEQLEEIKNQSLMILNNHNYKKSIRKELIISLYQDFEKTCSKKAAANKILNTVKALNFGNWYVDLFITTAKDKNYSDRIILKKIAQESLQTFEHIQARSLDGSDSKRNGIALHAHCNGERANIPYPLFLKIRPQMIKNTQKQIAKIITFITHKKLTGYDEYPIGVKKTLIEQTDKQIVINIKKYLKFRQKQQLLLIEKNQAEVEKNTKKLIAAKENARNTANKIEDLEKQIKEQLKQLDQLKRSNEKQKRKVNKQKTQNNLCHKKLKNAQERYERTLKLIEKDKKTEKFLAKFQKED